MYIYIYTYINDNSALFITPGWHNTSQTEKLGWDTRTSEWLVYMVDTYSPLAQFKILNREYSDKKLVDIHQTLSRLRNERNNLYLKTNLKMVWIGYVLSFSSRGLKEDKYIKDLHLTPKTVSSDYFFYHIYHTFDFPLSTTLNWLTRVRFQRSKTSPSDSVWVYSYYKLIQLLYISFNIYYNIYKWTMNCTYVAFARYFAASYLYKVLSLITTVYRVY